MFIIDSIINSFYKPHFIFQDTLIEIVLEPLKQLS